MRNDGNNLERIKGKICVIGTVNSGKTTLIARGTSNKYIHHASSKNLEYHDVQFQYKNKTIELKIHIYAGCERHNVNFPNNFSAIVMIIDPMQDLISQEKYFYEVLTTNSFDKSAACAHNSLFVASGVGVSVSCAKSVRAARLLILRRDGVAVAFARL